MLDPDSTLTVRYSALFPSDPTQASLKELVLSLTTLEAHVAPYVDLKVILYVSRSDLRSYERVTRRFPLPITLLPLDDLADFAADVEFANGIQHCETVDRICILRLLNDFRHIPVSANRLFVGCDVFFVAPPDEILSACWSTSRTGDLLYMVDGHTFGGAMYTLRHFHGPHLAGLLGDFYYLPPRVALSEAAIKGCLRLVDGWPAQECRYVPAIHYRSTQSEQQALSILLAQARARPLPTERYSHIAARAGMAVVHTHDLESVLNLLPPPVTERFHATLSGIVAEP